MPCDPSENRVLRLENGIVMEQDFLTKLRSLGKRYNINQIVPLRTKDICVAHWVRLKCKYGCTKYGTTWCCPPETPTPEKTKVMLSEYSTALMLCAKFGNGHFYKNDNEKRRIQVHTWKGTVALERQLFLWGYYKAFALVAESCALCKECLYPDQCRFPEYRRPSVESCSIDVFQTLKNIGKEFYLAKDVSQEYNHYSIILLE